VELSRGFNAYAALFELHGQGSWDLGQDELITFFRQSDQTSATIGMRQAGTFKVLAGLAGHGGIPESKAKKPQKTGKSTAPAKKKVLKELPQVNAQHNQNVKELDGGGAFGLTVRVEINLPADGTKETYDNIFKSIKENLLGG